MEHIKDFDEFLNEKAQIEDQFELMDEIIKIVPSLRPKFFDATFRDKHAMRSWVSKQESKGKVILDIADGSDTFSLLSVEPKDVDALMALNSSLEGMEIVSLDKTWRT